MSMDGPAINSLREERPAVTGRRPVRDRPRAQASIQYSASDMVPAPLTTAQCLRGIHPMCAFARTLLRLLGRVPVALALLLAVMASQPLTR